MTVTLFRAAAFAEACSWLGLLIGMLVKYTGNGELGVQIFGPIHGGLFMAYALLAVSAGRELGWSSRMTTIALLAAIPPFVTLFIERRVARDVAGRVVGDVDPA